MLEMPIVRSNLTQTAVVSLLSLVALTLLGLVLAYWTWAWLGPRAEPRAQIAAEPVGRTASANALFGQAQTRVSSEAPPAMAIKLLGVFAATGDKPGYAVVQLGAKQVIAVRAGEEVTPGVRLVKVFPDRVTLARTGASESLELAERRTSSPPLAPVNRK